MSRKNYLEQDFPSFSDRVTRAARDGRLNAEPLIRTMERALTVASGIGAVLRIQAANTVRSEARAAGDESEPPLSSGTMYSLLELARVSAETLESEIEGVADWAEKHGVREANEYGD